jgi:hypothetical protein
MQGGRAAASTMGRRDAAGVWELRTRQCGDTEVTRPSREVNALSRVVGGRAQGGGRPIRDAPSRWSRWESAQTGGRREETAVAAGRERFAEGAHGQQRASDEERARGEASALATTMTTTTMMLFSRGSLSVAGRATRVMGWRRRKGEDGRSRGEAGSRGFCGGWVVAACLDGWKRLLRAAR